MKHTARILLTGLLALMAPTACTSQAKTSPTPSDAADTEKASAPVTVNADVGEAQARVSVRFDAPASDVRVNVSGVDGLVVTSEAMPVEGASFVEAGSTTFDVAFTPGAGRSHLVVAVSGTFRGAPRTKVASFAIGTPTVEQQKRGDPVITGSDGGRIKVMPAEVQ